MTDYQTLVVQIDGVVRGTIHVPVGEIAAGVVRGNVISLATKPTKKDKRYENVSGPDAKAARAVSIRAHQAYLESLGYEPVEVEL